MYLDDSYPPSLILYGHMYLEICPFLLDFPVYLNTGSKNIPNDSLEFLGICCYLPFFVSGFINLGLFPLHFSQIYKSYLFFKEPAFSFIDSLYGFVSLKSILFISKYCYSYLFLGANSLIKFLPAFHDEPVLIFAPCKQKIVGPSFLIQFAKWYLFMGELSP
jgi:hypothetical protein